MNFWNQWNKTRFFLFVLIIKFSKLHYYKNLKILIVFCVNYSNFKYKTNPFKFRNLFGKHFYTFLSFYFETSILINFFLFSNVFEMWKFTNGIFNFRLDTVTKFFLLKISVGSIRSTLWILIVLVVDFSSKKIKVKNFIRSV